MLNTELNNCENCYTISPNENENENVEVEDKSNDISRKWELQYGKEKLIVKLMGEGKFFFHDSSGVSMGSFSVDDIFRYIGRTCDKFDQIKMDNTTIKLIENTICENMQNGTCKLNINSPFMIDIDLLIELNNMLKRYEDTHILENDICIKKNKLFIKKIAEHTMNVITEISRRNAHDMNEKTKSKLLRISIGIVYRLTQYISSEISEQKQEYDNLLNTFESLEKLEHDIKNKIDAVGE